MTGFTGHFEWNEAGTMVRALHSNRATIWCRTEADARDLAAKFQRHTLHWPAPNHPAETLCDDKAWTKFYASDAADITCVKCEAALYRPHSPAALGRAVVREIPPQ